MTRYVTVEMEVDNVGKMDKTGAKCVLKGEASVDRVGTRHVPYLYSVPDRIRSYYGDQL